MFALPLRCDQFNAFFSLVPVKFIQQIKHVAGKHPGFSQQSLHAGFFKYFKRGAVCCQQKNRTITQLPSIGGSDGTKNWLHLKSCFFFIAPPSGQAWKLGIGSMLLINVNSCDTTGTRVEIFITAPTRKVHTPVVQSQFNISCSMSDVESCKSSSLMCGFGNCFHRNHLPRIIIDATKKNQ